MADFLQGFLGTQQAGVEARNDVTVAIRNWFANRNPLVTRLPYVPVERVDFQMFTHKYRARSTVLGTAISSAAQSTLTVADATFLMNHDVLEVVDSATGNVERVQISGDPTNSTTVNVTRGLWSQIGGASGTTPLSSASANSTVNLIGNSRNGAEVNQTGLTTVGVPRTQYCQTFQFPVQIGGSAQTARAQVLPGGIQTPFDFNMTVQLQNMVDDIENCLYYGIAQAPNDSTAVTAKMNGLRSIFQTNNISSLTGATPVNAAAYGSTDLVRDTLQAARSGGGEPDLLVVSTNFMSGFATWGQAIQRVPAGETVFGTPINILEAPFLHGVTIVEAPLLRPFTAIALTSSEVYIRNKRNPFWQLRGSRGDMVEGDWIAEMAIEVVNESHHAWVEGITAFSRELTFAVFDVQCSVFSPDGPLPSSLSTEHCLRRPSGMWRFRGTPHYLDAQGDRLGLSKVLTDRARHNPEVYRASVLLGQLCERYHQAPKEGGRAVIFPAELAQIRGTLGQCELELGKLHALAAAAQAMVDEAHRAFGLEPPERHFRVQCDFDDLPEPADLTPIKLTDARTAKAK